MLRLLVLEPTSKTVHLGCWVGKTHGIHSNHKAAPILEHRSLEWARNVKPLHLHYTVSGTTWKMRPQVSSIFSSGGKAECQSNLWQDKAEPVGADDPGARCHCPLMAHPREVQGSHRPWTSLGWQMVSAYGCTFMT